MALEIERRWILKTDRNLLPRFKQFRSSYICQGYISGPEDSLALRVRVYNGSKAVLTIKKHVSYGVNKVFEYIIPEKEAQELLKECSGLQICKNRYYLPIPGTELQFEIDVFHNEFSGLIIAEIELPSLEYQVNVPEFFGEEITRVSGVSNFSMAHFPDEVKRTLQLQGAVFDSPSKGD